MTLNERLHRARERRAARALGREAALGMTDHIELHLVAPPTHPPAVPTVATCRECGTPASVDVVDLRGDRAQLRCPACAQRWSTAISEHHAAHG